MHTIKYLAFLITVGVVAGVSFAQASIFDWATPYVQDPLFGAPQQGTFHKDLLPISNDTYSVGSSTDEWLNIYSKNASSTNSTVTNIWNTNLFSVTGDFTTLTADDADFGTLLITTIATSTNLTVTNLTATNASTTYLTVSNTAWINNLSATNATTTTFRASGLATFGGNVGIGTTTPGAKLHIADLDSGNISSDVFKLENRADNVNEYLGLTFKTYVGGDGPHAAIRAINGPSATDARLGFFTTTDGGTNLTEKLSIDHLGNVGIGTTAPGAKLDVQGLISGQYINATSTTATSTFSGGFTAGNNAGLTVSAASPLGSVFISTAGNVGIGTTNPTSILRLGTTFDNDATTPTLSFGDGDSGIYESADDTLNIAIAGTSRAYFNSSLFALYNGAGLRNIGATSVAPNIVPAVTDLDTGIGSAGDNILSLIAGGTNGLNVISTGNVGIGTTTPTLAQLVVNNGIWAGGDISGLSITDRTPYPKDLQEAYNSVNSMTGKNGQVDHSKLDPFIKSIVISTTTKEFMRNGTTTSEIITTTSEGRNLSALVSAQNMVIQDILKKIDMPLGSFDSNGNLKQEILNEVDIKLSGMKEVIKKEIIDEIKNMKWQDKLKLLW